MKTIKEYLELLLKYKIRLYNFLQSKGIDCSLDEKFNTLIPKLKRIKSKGNFVVLSSGFVMAGALLNDEEMYEAITAINNRTIDSIAYLFYECPNITKLPLYLFETSGVTNSPNKFTSLTGPQVYELDAHGCDLSGFLVASDASITSNYHSTKFSKINLDNTKLRKGATTLFCSVSGISASPDLVEVSINDAQYIGNECTNLLGRYISYTDNYQSISNSKLKLVGSPSITFDTPLKIFQGCISGITEGEYVQLNNISFEDNCEFAGSLIYNKQLKQFPFDLSVLEGKSVRNLIINNNPKMEGDLIFPNCNIAYTFDLKEKFKNLNRIKNFDMSGVNISSSKTTELFERTFENIGSGLTEEELEGSVFKVPNNLFNSPILAGLHYTFYNNKLVNGVLNLDVKFKVNGKSTSGSSGYNGLYSTFNGTNVEEAYVHISEAVSDNVDLSYTFNNCPKLKKLRVSIESDTTNTYFNAAYIVGDSSASYGTPSSTFDALEDINIDFNNKQTNASRTIPLQSLYTTANLPSLKVYSISNVKTNYLPFITSYTFTNVGKRLPNLEKVEFINCDLSGLTSASYFLAYTSPKNLDISTIDLGSVDNMEGLLKGCNQLESVNFCTNLGKGFKTSTTHIFDLSYSTLLEYTSLMGIINKLYDLNITFGVYDEEGNPGTGVLKGTHRLTLGSTNKAKLTAEEIAIATNKGWTVM